MTAITIFDLHKTYANSFYALKGINLSIDEGDFFALLGTNGAGKSTTINIMTTLTNPTSGSVEILGHDIKKNPWEAKRMVGLVPQEFNLSIFEKTQDIVIQQGGYYGLDYKTAKANTKKYLQELEIWDKRDQKVSALSGGMKRRLMIARALVHEPKVLILDEPTAGVDVEIRHSMWQFLQKINKQGTTIILTTHYLEEAERLCKNVAIIDAGKILVNTSMKTLLKRVNDQCLNLDLVEPLTEEPVLTGIKTKLIDNTTLQVFLPRDISMNKLFGMLTRQKIIVENINRVSGQLEELFVNMTSKKK